MAIRIHDVTSVSLDDLPWPCRGCTFWESAHGTAPRHGPDTEAGGTASPAAPEKQAWWQATQLEWGVPGKAAYAEGDLVGFALFGPTRYFPRSRMLGAAPSEDALLLATLWVSPDDRRHGAATMLLQAVLRETYRRGAQALEAYGRRGLEEEPPMGGCVLPEGFLLASGFTLLREDAEYPLLRLDLRQTARWQRSFGQALEGVLGLLGRRERARPAPAPARTVANPR